MAAPSSPSSSMQVTVSLLPVSLSLVHIPRCRLLELSHPIIRQILLPNPSFLNLTCNQVELSIFAEHHVLRDFEPIARKDRQRIRSRSGSSSRSRADSWPEEDLVEVSVDTWRVLQIDSHSSGLGNAGARVHELSAPLAAAGISILYQSSYMSDFIFVKQIRLQEVIPILASAGYDLYCSDPDHLTAQMSPLHSPILRGSDDGPPLDLSSGAVLTRTRSNTDESLHGRAAMLMSLPPPALPEEPGTTPSRPTAVRTKSLSPSSSDVQLLPTDLTCVGLADDAADVWALKIVKLVAYPELIIPKTVDVESIIVPKPVQSEVPYSDIPEEAPSRTPSPSTSLSSEGEDGYFSASPPNQSSTSLVSSAASRSAESLPTTGTQLETRKVADRPSHLHRINPSTPQPLTPVHVRDIPSHFAISPLSPTPSSRHRRRITPNYAIPFFSLTRTQEGSSLTAPTTVLTSLFPPSERHMVICSDELDALDSPAHPVAEAEEMDDEGHEMGDKNGPMRCLQIDLRQFGLDKHGLVNRYSRVLGENGINHMYSSTFKTANLLVDTPHAARAQALLRAC